MGLSLAAPTLILLVALITDIRTRKVPNVWVLISIVIALASSYYFYEFDGLKQGAIAAGMALLLTLPLVLLGALGAGDMKIMFAFGLAGTYQQVFSVIVFSFLWGALIGIGISIVRGRARALLINTFKILTSQPRDDVELLKIPYTVALMLGWITYLVLGAQQGALL
ncbi:MAG: prepilin peptidase [Bdellovibrionales bacterium]|nr:prepilin peptidase [Bdellovibrionales bacterium]